MFSQPPNSPALGGPVAGPMNPAVPQPQAPQVFQYGLTRAANLAQVLKEDKAANDTKQASPLVSSIASYIRTQWTIALDAKRNHIEERLLKALRARRGEYDPDKKRQIADMGGSDVYAGLTSVKCRAAGSWIRDVMLGTGSDRPWAIRPTPVPELPKEINDLLVQQAIGPIKTAMMTGQPVDQVQVVSMMSMLRDQALAAVREEATHRTERMADKMEDQLVEGGFIEALDAFIDDLTTFPAAIIKGPVVRKKPILKWGPGGEPQVTDTLVLEWERVSPFDMFPSPGSTNIDDGFLIQKHKLSRQDLQQMVGVEGYDDTAIAQVLSDHGRDGLSEWLTNESAQADAEGKSTMGIATNPDGLIDALQYWGSVQGKLLVEWGMPTKDVPDELKEYNVEAWLIGSTVIKAVLNYDPLARKPYYKASYEEVPGSWWGNSVADLVADSQDIVNACARAMVNNMALSSGPQVSVNIDRLAIGEDVTNLQPWRIWQTTSDPSGGGSMPMEFFQPTSNINELMALFEKFSTMADEYSGIPRYMTGDASTGGAGRTASGLSMLISNAGKSIKQVINNLDVHVMKRLLDRLYYYNMRYLNDPELKGDIQIVARGASALIAKEAAQVRRNEFLQATANPIDMQIVGVEGRAAVLREVAKGLDMNVDKIVPTVEVLRQKLATAASLAQPPPAPGQQALPAPGGGQQLMDGAPTTDNFSPPPQGGQ